MAEIFEGNKESQKINDRTKNSIAMLNGKPGLAILRNNQSQSQVKFTETKKRTAESIGVECEIIDYSADAQTEQIVELILDIEEKFTGILFQLPTLRQIDRYRIFNAIPYEKDVEALSAARMGELFQRRAEIYSPVATAMIHAAKTSGRQISGSKTVVIGSNYYIGKPIAQKMYELGSTVTMCGSRTPDLSEFTTEADFLFSCSGKIDLVRPDMVSSESVIIDGGFELDEKGRIHGDVHQDCAEKASFLTPVPGGIGPLTVAYIFENLLKLYKYSST